MRYAQVVLGLPLDKDFDYSLPPELSAAAQPGCRVKVNFRGKKETAYIIAVSDQSSFPVVKPVISLIDDAPVISPVMLSLCKSLAEYYCCSWGEMIESALPDTLRRGSRVDLPAGACGPSARGDFGVSVLHAEDVEKRWERYGELISRTIGAGKRVIVLLPAAGAIPAACASIEKIVKGASVGMMFRKQPDELEAWRAVSTDRYTVVAGTRSAVFAPVRDLGLIIVDEEQDYGYKQDQVPHYHARIAALQRGREEGCAVVLGASAPSLEARKLVKDGEARYEREPAARRPLIKIIDTTRLPYGTRSRVFVSKYLEDAIVASLAAKEKALIFINRRGFATTGACGGCGARLTCPKCSTNLVYYFREQEMRCNFCGFRGPVPRLCPACDSGYIKFTGSGTEKVESELARMFPSARLSIVEPDGPLDLERADIFVATQSILSHPGCRFSLTGVLSLDNSLNHADFRATEKAFSLLTGLAGMTAKQLVVQTTVPDHYAVSAVVKGDPELFYDKEFSLREGLQFPPFVHFAMVKCRGSKEDGVRAAAETLFKAFSENARKGIAVLSLNPGLPARIRGKYHWNILLSAADPLLVSAFIKNNLKDFRKSGIIVTVDIDVI